MIETLFNRSAVTAATQNSLALRRNHSSEGSTTTTNAPASAQSGAQYDFASIFGAASDERTTTTSAINSAAAKTITSAAQLTESIAAATTRVTNGPKSLEESVTGSTIPAATTSDGTASTTTSSTGAASTASQTATVTTTTPAATATTPGIQALVSAIMNGSFQGTNVTDPSKLQETTPIGTDTMPNFYYASDQTAAQLAQLLGGTVVQGKAFGQDVGWTEPNANFIQLPNGQTFNAADVAYYSRSGAEGPATLTAAITQTINQGAAWTNYYKNGGAMPTFSMGYIGPPIAGMSYPAGMIGADGNVINPILQPSNTQGT